MWETWVRSLGWEDPWRRAREPTPAFLPGESRCTEEPGGLQSMGLPRVRRAWQTQHSTQHGRAVKSWGTGGYCRKRSENHWWSSPDTVGLPWRLRWKESACSAGDLGSVLGGKIPWRRKWKPRNTQYSCPENPMDRGAWWAIVHGVAKSRLQGSHWCTHNDLGNVKKENSMDGGASEAIPQEVTKSQTWLSDFIFSFKKENPGWKEIFIYFSKWDYLSLLLKLLVFWWRLSSLFFLSLWIFFKFHLRKFKCK